MAAKKGETSNRPCQCDNCEWHGRENELNNISHLWELRIIFCHTLSRRLQNELNNISHLWERLDPGGVVPAGECPDCGCLAYLDQGAESTERKGTKND